MIVQCAVQFSLVMKQPPYISRSPADKNPGLIGPQTTVTTVPDLAFQGVALILPLWLLTDLKRRNCFMVCIFYSHTSLLDTIAIVFTQCPPRINESKSRMSTVTTSP